MYWVRYIFWNKKEQRTRAGWRIFIHAALWIFVPAILQVIAALIQTGAIPSATFSDMALNEIIVQFSVNLSAVWAITWVATRLLDRRNFADLGLHLNTNWWLDFAFGLGLGAFLIGLIFLFEWLNGWVIIADTFQSSPSLGIPFTIAIFGPLVAFIVVGITEELLSRGYQLRNMAEGIYHPRIGPQAAIILAWFASSGLFGLLHVFNPNATLISTLYLIVAGLFLGLGYILTGSLAIPIGLHISWNFVQGNVFGFPVSGNAFNTVTFIAIEQHGPDSWTGGAFGPEAGFLGLLAIGLGCFLTVLWVRARYGTTSLQHQLAIYNTPNTEKAK